MLLAHTARQLMAGQACAKLQCCLPCLIHLQAAASRWICHGWQVC
jgi:hypothetical protein